MWFLVKPRRGSRTGCSIGIFWEEPTAARETAGAASRAQGFPGPKIGA